MKWFRKKRTDALDYDMQYAIDSFNIVPAAMSNSDKFNSDGQDCVEKEYASLKNKNVDDLNTDISTGVHKGDSHYEIAHLNKEFIEILGCAKNLFSKRFGEAVLLYEKIQFFEKDAITKEKELEIAEKALFEWRNK